MQKYKEFSRLKHIKLVLVPSEPELEKIEIIKITDNFTNVLYKEISADDDLRELFEELLRDI